METHNGTDDGKGRILVVDDEAELRGLLARYLGSRGYRVRQAGDGGELERLLSRESFDVLVLDLMLPGEDGLAICRRLRGAGETIPILMLTARSEPIDRIVGLEMGADDYLPKPFEPRELLARIEALLRRQRILGAHLHAHPEPIQRFGPFELDGGARRLRRDGADILLSTAEFDLLRTLAANADRPLSREKLIELAHGSTAGLTDRAIDVQILRLRRLVEPDPANPRFILTVRGKGYVLRTRDEP
ncbi:MAG: response regulator [Rhodocyclaceae bacterium]|jgi:two-component system phosphate regulon response regulator OmpR|nr:response regulator [Rhodocyclaceae bacterium]